jgi:hypothetical protein
VIHPAKVVRLLQQAAQQLTSRQCEMQAAFPANCT